MLVRKHYIKPEQVDRNHKQNVEVVSFNLFGFIPVYVTKAYIGNIVYSPK